MEERISVRELHDRAGANDQQVWVETLVLLRETQRFALCRKTVGRRWLVQWAEPHYYFAMADARARLVNDDGAPGDGCCMYSGHAQ